MTRLRWIVGIPGRWAQHRVDQANAAAQHYPTIAELIAKVDHLIVGYQHHACGWMVQCSCGFRADCLPDRITAVDVGADHQLGVVTT